MVDAVMRLNRHVLDEQRGNLRSKAIMNVPDSHMANDERMSRVRPDSAYSLAEIEAIESLGAVGFVVLETDEGKRADVNVGRTAIGLHDGQHQPRFAGRRRLV